MQIRELRRRVQLALLEHALLLESGVLAGHREILAAPLAERLREQALRLRLVLHLCLRRLARAGDPQVGGVARGLAAREHRVRAARAGRRRPLRRDRLRQLAIHGELARAGLLTVRDRLELADLRQLPGAELRLLRRVDLRRLAELDAAGLRRGARADGAERALDHAGRVVGVLTLDRRVQLRLVVTQQPGLEAHGQVVLAAGNGRSACRLTPPVSDSSVISYAAPATP